MKFSTRAGYGLRAVVNLAKAHPKQKSVQEISKEEGISLKYLEQLFSTLRRNKLIASQKGREGGYVLSKTPSNIKVGEIIEILEGPIVTMACAQGKCEAKCSCDSSIVWTKLQRQIKKTLYGIKLSELIK
ncbi:MAG: Rrf2 family transcriptional regulator [bacterium]|nr:Rrf2 family transcriptional regulator [bacterium]